jgi:acid phosphatase (class A)
MVSKSSLAGLLAAALLCAAPLQAQTPILLTPDQYDPAKVLLPPPLRGSARERSELIELKHDQTAPAARIAAAAWEDGHEDAGIFQTVIGPGFDMARLPATAALMHLVLKNESAASGAAKRVFHRPRPWEVDPSLKTCTPHAPGPANNSYPSGHASIGYAMAVVLARLMPGKANAIMARAAAYAENRIVCGYHFRSDIEAGKTFGLIVGNALLRNPGACPYYDAAAAELHAAHLTN